MKTGIIKSVTITFDDGYEEIFTAEEDRLTLLDYSMERQIGNYMDGHQVLGKLICTITLKYIVKEQ